jgi:Metal binding domain of Ada
MSHEDFNMSPLGRTFTLIGRSGESYQSPVPGILGGHRGNKIYGRLDCRAALQAIARGGYVKHRVFFLDETAAIGSGYRPCAVCLPEKYAVWKKRQPPQIKAIAYET